MKTLILYIDRRLLKGAFFDPFNHHPLYKMESPRLRYIKINCDGSLKYSSTVGGFTLWDWMGKVIKAGTANYGRSSILIAKARAQRDGV